MSTQLYRVWLHEGVTMPVKRVGIDPGFSEHVICVADKLNRQAFSLSLEKLEGLPFVVITHTESQHQTHVPLTNVKAVEVLTDKHTELMTDPKRGQGHTGLVTRLF